MFKSIFEMEEEKVYLLGGKEFKKSEGRLLFRNSEGLWDYSMLNEMKEVPENKEADVIVYLGDIVLIDGEQFIVANPELDKAALICLADGQRFDEPIFACNLSLFFGIGIRLKALTGPGVEIDDIIRAEKF